MKSEKEKMLAGELYSPLDPELFRERQRVRLLFKAFNDTSDDQRAERLRLLQEIIPMAGKNLWIEPPFYCDYGGNITIGDHVYFNFNCIILDIAPVTIGSNVMFAPGVHIYAATHPLNAAQRRSGLELGKPISIGDDVWVGGGVIICPGVSIGSRSVIGAGSVVTKDIPDGVLAVGNPCRVIREIEE
jgi:maltose O-acetyltransferase